jgi:hypothetical protein
MAWLIVKKQASPNYLTEHKVINFNPFAQDLNFRVSKLTRVNKNNIILFKIEQGNIILKLNKKSN